MRKAIGIVEKKRKIEGVKLMMYMQPLEVCVICDGEPREGHIVMRTACARGFEVMDLSEMGSGHCFGGCLSSCPEIKVRPYTGGSITFKIG